MKLDEIGQTIQNEELNGVLNNLRWRISQQYLMVNEKGQPLISTLTAEDNRYVTTDEQTLTLHDAQEQHFNEMKRDLKLRNYFLKKTLPANEYLWPLTTGPQGTQISLRIPEELFTELYNCKFKGYQVDYYDFRNQIYLKLAQGFERVAYLLTYLSGATPYQWNEKGKENGHTCRSYHTYDLLKNLQEQVPDYRTLNTYLQTKNATAKVQLEGQFDQQGVTMLILKNFDLDPAFGQGISPQILELINVLVGYLLMGTGCPNERLLQQTKEARQKDLQVAHANPFKHPQCEQTLHNLLEDINHFAKSQSYGPAWENAYHTLRAKLDDPTETPAALLLRQQGGTSAFDFIKQLAIKNQTEAAFKTTLSSNTLMVLQAAFVRGIEYQVLDAHNDLVQLGTHFVTHGLQSEQDPAVMANVWDNKQLAKQLVTKLPVQISQAWIVKNIQQATALYPMIKNKAVVIKNAVGHTDGKGTLYRLAPTKREFLDSVSLMLKEIYAVLVEQVVAGSTYQALLLNGKVVSLIERIPENIVGDGHSTVRQLITKKHLLLGQNERHTLLSQDIDLDQTVPRGVQTFLRYDTFSGTQYESFDALSETNATYLAVLEDMAIELHLRTGFIDVVIPNIYKEYSTAHPELITFLSAHANGELKKHTDLLLNHHHDVAALIVDKFTHK